MTAPTEFDKALDELNLTYTQKELVKQAVDKLVIGPYETASGKYPISDSTRERVALINTRLDEQRRRVRG